MVGIPMVKKEAPDAHSHLANMHKVRPSHNKDLICTHMTTHMTTHMSTAIVIATMNIRMTIAPSLTKARREYCSPPLDVR